MYWCAFNKGRCCPLLLLLSGSRFMLLLPLSAEEGLSMKGGLLSKSCVCALVWISTNVSADWCASPVRGSCFLCVCVCVSMWTGRMSAEQMLFFFKHCFSFPHFSVFQPSSVLPLYGFHTFFFFIFLCLFTLISPASFCVKWHWMCWIKFGNRKWWVASFCCYDIIFIMCQSGV